MKSKIIIMFLLILLTMYGVSALEINNIYSPIPDSTKTTNRTVNFKFQVDNDVKYCFIEIGLTNGTKIGSHASSTLATTNLNNRIFNRTQLIGIDSAINKYHNWTVYCGINNTEATKINTYKFKLNTIRPNIVTPKNGTTYNSVTLKLNITTGNAIADHYYCSFKTNLSNGTGVVYKNLVKNTSRLWVNLSGYSTVLSSKNGTWHKLTFRCNDSSGFYESEKVYFRTDTQNPIVSYVNATILNSVFNATVKIYDNNTVNCSAKIYNRTNNLIGTVWGTPTTANSKLSTCLIPITTNNINTEGTFKLWYNSHDKAGRKGVNSLNHTAIKKTLYSGWNMFSFSDTNRTILKVCQMIDGCTQASLFNNTAKTFLTYSTSVPGTNNGTQIRSGWAVFVYVSKTTTILMNENYPKAKTAEDNATLKKGWNAVALTKQTTLNRTMNAIAIVKKTKNITYSSYLDNANSKYYTCIANSTRCSGTTLKPTQINLYQGTAVWMMSNGNVTINRTSVVN